MKLKYSPSSYARNMEKLDELRKTTARQAEEIKALRIVVQAHEGLFFRGSDQHPEAMRKLKFAQQNLSRFHARHRQTREPLALLNRQEPKISPQRRDLRISA